jgi:hypothetical protein
MISLPIEGNNGGNNHECCARWQHSLVLEQVYGLFKSAIRIRFQKAKGDSCLPHNVQMGLVPTRPPIIRSRGTCSAALSRCTMLEHPCGSISPELTGTLWKIVETFSTNGRCPGGYSKRAPPEYKSGALLEFQSARSCTTLLHGCLLV